MTCVVAVTEGGKVWMGADSAGVGGLSLSVRRDPKIFQVEQFLFGFCGSFRMGQLLQYRLKPPQHAADCSTERYMNTEFVDEVRHVLRAGGFLRTNHGEETGGLFLVGYVGRIFRVDSDFQVAEAIEPFSAVGCGADLALGALYATRGQAPHARIHTALEAAEAFSAGVRRPFLLEHVEAQQPAPGVPVNRIGSAGQPWPTLG